MSFWVSDVHTVPLRADGGCDERLLTREVRTARRILERRPRQELCSPNDPQPMLVLRYTARAYVRAFPRALYLRS